MNAVARGHEALDAIRTLGDTRREGVLLLALARYVWYRGDTDESDEMVRQAIAVLEQLPPGPELVGGYMRMSGMGATDYDLRTATKWGERAIALAEHLDEPEQRGIRRSLLVQKLRKRAAQFGKPASVLRARPSLTPTDSLPESNQSDHRISVAESASISARD